MNLKAINMKYNDSNLELTHLFVEGFGWENTIFLPSDFDTILKHPIKETDGSTIYYGYKFKDNGEYTEIRKFKGILK